MSLINEKDLYKIIKSMSYTELETLSQEIRNFLIDSISKTGGHLASNLGIVELTIALHRVFNFEKDKLIWDVGHQAYVHKILTNRKDKFNSLRQFKGLSGFPKTKESKFDHFDVGHSSTSISVALGFAKARDLKSESNHVIAVIGDGAIGNGLAFEAMNNIENTRMIVILNDNEMSISKNVGSVSKVLIKLTTKQSYINSKKSIKKILTSIPIVGKISKKLLSGFKEAIEYDSYFTELGFKYVGPINGHNLEEIEKYLNIVKVYDGPVLLHVITKKGKGYPYAEEYPERYHGVNPFDCTKLIEVSNNGYSKLLGEKLTNLAKRNKNIIAISAAMTDNTGLKVFQDNYPNRYFDVGIAESHAITFAASLASAGLKPYVVIYSSFLQRTYDEIIHDVCLQSLNVTMCIDRAGLVGNDGETHQGIFDLSYLTHIPNMTIIAPSSSKTFENTLEFSETFTKPLAIRYPKGKEELCHNDCKIEYGKSNILKNGNDLTIIGVGKMTSTALKITELLNKKYNIEIIDAIFVKPLDEKTILKSVKKTKNLFIIEDNLIIGGYGSLVLNLLNENNINIKTKIYAYNDKFIEQGSIEELERANKMDANSIAKDIERVMK